MFKNQKKILLIILTVTFQTQSSLYSRACGALKCAGGIVIAGASVCATGILCSAVLYSPECLNSGGDIFKESLKMSSEGASDFWTGNENLRRILTSEVDEENAEKAMGVIGAFMTTLSDDLMGVLKGEKSDEEKMKEFKQKYDTLVGKLPGMEQDLLSKNFKDVVFTNYEMEDVPEIGGKLSTYLDSKVFNGVLKAGVTLWMTLAKIRMKKMMSAEAKKYFDENISTVTDQITKIEKRMMILV